MVIEDAIVFMNAVARAYGPKVAVNAASLTLRRGRILGLLGASGSGKSALLRLVAGLDRSTAAASASTDRRSRRPVALSRPRPAASASCSRTPPCIQI